MEILSYLLSAALHRGHDSVAIGDVDARVEFSDDCEVALRMAAQEVADDRFAVAIGLGGIQESNSFSMCKQKNFVGLNPRRAAGPVSDAVIHA